MHQLASTLSLTIPKETKLMTTTTMTMTMMPSLRLL